MQSQLTCESWWQSKLMTRSLLCLALGMVAVSGAAEDSVPAIHQSSATDIQMNGWWGDLEEDEAEATRAVLGLSTRPQETVAFLKDKIKPLKLDAVQLKAYLLRLGSSNEALWKKAFDDLEYYDPRLAMHLQALMDNVIETPTRQRMVEVLSCREPGSLKEWQVKLRNHGDIYMFDRDKYS
jgi:hypothetical protein